MLSENSIRVLERRYLKKDATGKLMETPDGMFHRVAKAIAGEDEVLEKRFYTLMSNLAFMPNSPTLMNAGNELGQLSACFVLPVEDSMEGIFDAIKYAALIHKSGGGTGFSFSRLRRRGSAVNSTGGVASGPISFMKVFNAATDAVKQGGVRRGANMGILRIDHPDILDFIQCKKDTTEINNFNLSVGITEKFMEAVLANRPYDLVDPNSKKVVGQLNAQEVFDLIVEMAWSNGEPGIIFLDRMNRDNIVPSLGEIESTNPCGEQPLLPYESCNLGSINLLACVQKNAAGKYEIDYEKLGAVVDDAVVFLDNVIDRNKYPLDIIGETTRRTRKIGLGVMGFADLLIRLEIPYCSEEGVKTAEEVMGFIDRRSKERSAKLAQERGCFPAWEQSIYAEKGMKLRNGTTTTIAPTGTISIISGVSSGVEPLFAISYIRNIMDNDELPEVNPLFEEVAKARGFYSVSLMRKIAQAGSVAHMEEVPEDVRKVFVTAHDISPIWHIKMQAAFQRHTDNAVSKTVNFRHEATQEEVAEVYTLAYELGCKGVTIYRDGSRDSQVLNIGAVNKGASVENCEECTSPDICEADAILPRERPHMTYGVTEKTRIGCGNLYITVNSDEHGICEVFTNLGRAGGCPSQSEATSRLISVALRAGVDVSAIVEQLKGIRCLSTVRQKGLNVLSCPDAIGKAIEKQMRWMKERSEFYTNGETDCALGDCASCEEACGVNGPTITVEPDLSKNMKYCPECGNKIQHEGGCVICNNCGYSKCN